MIPLPQNYKKNGYAYTIIFRDPGFAIAEQKSDLGTIVGYEVFKIEKKESFCLGSHNYPAMEKVPSSSHWGTSAFTCNTIADAMAKLNQLKTNSLVS